MLRADDLVLNVRQRRLAHELLPLLLRGFLHFVGLALLFGNLPVGLCLHQLSRWMDVADKRVDGLHIIGGQRLADVASGFHLALVSPPPSNSKTAATRATTTTPPPTIAARRRPRTNSTWSG